MTSSQSTHETGQQVPRPGPRPSDFRFGKEIGHGFFSTVYRAKEIASDSEYAIKVVEKGHVCRNKAVKAVIMEKEVLKRTNHAFIVRLHYTFQDQSRLFYVLDYLPGGDLLSYLNRLTCFDCNGTRFYAAEMFTALTYLHSQSIVHRDLKPENILFTDRMHIKLVDFGSAIILNDPAVKAPSFTGTYLYVSPEMLSSASHGFDDSDDEGSGSPKTAEPMYSFAQLAYLMDYWAFGCVIYQMIAGLPPFRVGRNQHEYEIFGKINGLSYDFVDGFDPVARDLVQQLLVIQPIKRLGSPSSGGPEAIRNHSFFTGINWSSLDEQTPPALIPNLEPIAPVGWDDVPAGFVEAQNYHLSREPGLMPLSATEDERAKLFSLQERNNPYHRFVRNRYILKQGVLFKRRGLFARKRMFLLTEGPHLFYVDMDSMTLKGEIPWSCALTPELKSNKLFFIHVPCRTFYLEDPVGEASEWVNAISKVKNIYFSDALSSSSPPSTSTTTAASVLENQISCDPPTV